MQKIPEEMTVTRTLETGVTASFIEGSVQRSCYPFPRQYVQFILKFKTTLWPLLGSRPSILLLLESEVDQVVHFNVSGVDGTNSVPIIDVCEDALIAACFSTKNLPAPLEGQALPSLERTGDTFLGECGSVDLYFLTLHVSFAHFHRPIFLMATQIFYEDP